MLGSFFGVKVTIKASLEDSRNPVVLIETDNKVTQACIDHLGGQSMVLGSIAQDLYSMCYRAQVLAVVHNLGKVNIQADWLPRWKYSLDGSTTTLTSSSTPRSFTR